MAEDHEFEITADLATPEPLPPEVASELATPLSVPATAELEENPTEPTEEASTQTEESGEGSGQAIPQDRPAPIVDIPGPALDEVPEQVRTDRPATLDLVELRQIFESGLESLTRAFDDKLALDVHKARQIDALHRELQEHKQGLLAEAIRPLLAGLVRLHNNLGRMALDLRGHEPEELTPERVARLLEEFQDDVEIVLEENGVSVFTEPTERFNRHRQSALRTVGTEDPEQVRRIARRLRPGFERDGQVLQKERVEVFVAAPAGPMEP